MFSPTDTRRNAFILVMALAGALCVASVLPVAAGQVGAGEIEQLERALAQAIGNRDVRTYDRLVADDYVVIDTSGAESTKAEILRAYKEDRVKRIVNISELKVRVFGNTAIVTGRLADSRVEGERIVPTVVRYIRVYARRNGIWRAVTQMSMPLPQQPPG